MASIFDLYLKDNIMINCEEYFMDYLESENFENESLTSEDRDLIENQVDNLLMIIEKTYLSFENETDALMEIIDKLIGFCIVGKMNEARLCNIINKLIEENK
jgi:hypothetical protein